LAPEKGLNLFLKAAREVLNTRPETEFLIVGEGPQRPMLESQACELGIAHAVVFTGVLDDMPDVYASMDIFVLPSLNEGLPLALLEAMAAGKPVVATRVGGVPGLVISERTGLLVETQNVTALRDSMLRLIDDPQLRHELGEAGQRLVAERFSAEKMAGNYLRMYRDIISTRAAAFESKQEKKAIA
jgi:glycosyltransferase involved in cell wall biosynthesis